MLQPRKRPSIPLERQVEVFGRDRWLCRWCHRPVVFAPAVRVLRATLRNRGISAPLAYHDAHWSRHSAPLLDHIGAVIDHVEALATGGEHDVANFVTACNKCNARKSDRSPEEFRSTKPGKPVRGGSREPECWDGLVAVFLAFSGEVELTDSERRWLGVLRRGELPLAPGPDAGGRAR